MFVSHVWSKLRGDDQNHLEEIQDLKAHLEHLQSILLEFDANNAPGESQFGWTFYDGLRPSIKLWIADIGEDMPWGDLIRAANKAEARAKIQGSTHLDQRCPKGKRPLKISLNTRDDQAENTKATLSQTKASSQAFDQLQVTEKAKEKARKEKKRRGHQEKRDRREGRDVSPAATGTNATQATEGQKKKRRNGQGSKTDISEITCYNCNKKGHYSRECTEQ